MIYEYEEPRWNDIDRGEQENSEIIFHCHFALHKSHIRLTRARTRTTAVRG
jgi:hypothetical protein